MPVMVIGDRVALEQATLVLLDNAIKYNRANGSVIVRASEEAGRAVLSVQDTGVGVEAGQLPLLGQRFYRVDKARARETGGAGLGLSIARALVAALGGTLTLRSTPDEGTTAIIALPLASTP